MVRSSCAQYTMAVPCYTLPVFMALFAATLLGLIQGITEFLPVSSTGHLILLRSLLGVVDQNALAFDAVLHLATAAAVIVYFRRDIWVLLQTCLRYVGRLPVGERDLALVLALMVGTVPAVVFGLLLEDLMETLFRAPLLVAVVLVLGSGLFVLAEHRYRARRAPREVTARMGLAVGFFQVLALIPGMSRSGATISGGMLLGLSRSEAARFAFLLAVPVILGAGAKKLLELASLDGAIAWLPILLAAIVAFVSGMLAIHFMLGFVRRHTLWPFVWYRLALAAVVVLAVVLG